ncbi:MAG: type II toxin-antitoxin system RelE/ParE family toxin [Anaerolineae bacterium]|nr:type II toxin-antitoxin system RelE/ParE family toxin [Anaerolineae bacterium]
MSYRVLMYPAAERERRKLPQPIRNRITEALLALESDPRPPGVTKLVGCLVEWRIRVGDHRIIYEIDDGAQEVRVLRIAHRREVYR